MSGFAGQMNDAQIADLLTYVRSSWGNKAPEVSADVVEARTGGIRDASGHGAKYPK